MTNQHQTWSQYNYVTTRSRVIVIMGPIRQEQLELFALEFWKSAEFDYVYTLESTSIIQSAPNLVTIYFTVRSWMSLIIGAIGPEQPKLFALELWKIEKFDFVYTLASTEFKININQSAPNLVEMYVTIRSWMSSITDLVICPWIRKTAILTFFTL